MATCKVSMNFAPNAMKKTVCNICDLTPFTLQDFEDIPSCIIWFSGCNMLCEYCYNLELVYESQKFISQEIILDFLTSRTGKLDGVVLCGGEPTLYNDLVSFCLKIKKLGFKIKLDTNGSNPNLLSLILPFIDFVALDFKAPKSQFKAITKSDLYYEFEKSFDILNNSTIDFEVRTTYHSELLSDQNLSQMADFLRRKNYKKSWYIQNFIEANCAQKKLKNSRKFQAFDLSADIIVR